MYLIFCVFPVAHIVIIILAACSVRRLTAYLLAFCGRRMGCGGLGFSVCFSLVSVDARIV